LVWPARAQRSSKPSSVSGNVGSPSRSAQALAIRYAPEAPALEAVAEALLGAATP